MCTRKQVCNGILCTYICETGTVEVNQWAVDSLKFQRKLQLDQPFMKFEAPGTHNSAISQAYGFGIEEDAIEAILGINLYKGDDEGEGVCQYLSITDQLRMGLRHIEIDIWWGTYVEKGHDIVVCHSPIPGYPFWEVEKAAAEKNISLGWDVRNLSCLGTWHNFTDILMEVRDFVDSTPDEIVMLYLDTKFPPFPEQATKGNKDMLDVFGDMIFLPGEGDPRNFTIRQLLAMGKRIIVEDHEEGWMHPSEGPVVVFNPDLWAHQFSADAFFEYPNCTIEGDSDWYGKEMVRALDGSFTEAATRCGVNIVSGDYQNPDSMQLFVWSWDLKEPRFAGGCPAIMPSGRWAVFDCNSSFRSACMGDNDLTWVPSVSAGPWKGTKAECPSGYTPSTPTNGRSNARLRDAVIAQTTWLSIESPL